MKRCFPSLSVYVCVSVCLSVYVCVSACLSLSVCLSVCLSMWLSVCLSICQSLCVSVCLSVCLSMWLSVCLSICQSLCVTVCLSVCLSVELWWSRDLGGVSPMHIRHDCLMWQGADFILDLWVWIAEPQVWTLWCKFINPVIVIILIISVKWADIYECFHHMSVKSSKN